jgi:hypothetical protein
MKLFHYYHSILLALVALIGIFGLSIWMNLEALSQKSHELKQQPVVTTLMQRITKKPLSTPMPLPITLLFAGDVMLDRSIRTVGEKQGYDYIFSDIRTFLKKWDAVVANFESPVTDFPSVSQDSVVGSRNNYIFTTHPNALKSLVANNISVVSIGNNHIGNFGEAGYQSTLKHLIDNHIEFFGDTAYSPEPLFLIKDIRGVKIAFINYNQFIPDGYAKTLTAISEAKKQKPNVLILVTHWDNEYKPTPAQVTITNAHTLFKLWKSIRAKKYTTHSAILYLISTFHPKL